MKLLIFDLDGTLLHTLPDLASACNAARKKMSLPALADNDYLPMIGRGVLNLVTTMLPEQMRNDETIQQAYEYFCTYYEQHLYTFTQPYPCISETLTRLRQEGYILALASNKYQEAAQQLVDHFFPNIFHFVYGKREGLAAKPDPMVVRHCIIQALKAYRHIDQVALFGDSYIDIQTAHNANITAVGCTWGYGEESKLLAAKPHHILHSPQQIYNLCCEL
jgi:phosphoglycolate phosphatase